MNLAVCCDGTWNTPDMEHDGTPVPTNVVRLFNAIDDSDGRQRKYYHPGVGTDASWSDKIMGGTVGKGLSKNVMSAYKWLAENYSNECKIWLFGFSRGAYTARSLAGMLGHAGLLKLDANADQGANWRDVEDAFEKGYRKRQPRAEWANGRTFHEGAKIHFIGVWDTVGALGIPEDYAILSLFNDKSKYRFHDTGLSDIVIHARHALALDELRESFMPTLWTAADGSPLKNFDDGERSLKQRWFPGVHCDVGGGYLETGLSDRALEWMISEASDRGLEFIAHMVAPAPANGRPQVNPDFQAPLHDSLTGAFKHLKTQPRAVPEIKPGVGGALDELDESAASRQARPPIFQAPYRAPIRLAVEGDSVKVAVFARERWNWTGIYLEAGALYEFGASGEWLDGDMKFDPDGKGGIFQIGRLVQSAGTLLGKLEKLIHLDNEHADLIGTKRHEELDWFVLVGAIANAGNPSQEGTSAPAEHFRIGSSATWIPKKSGYLYAYANDSWLFYENNRGGLNLSVTLKRLPPAGSRQPQS